MIMWMWALTEREMVCPLIVDTHIPTVNTLPYTPYILNILH